MITPSPDGLGPEGTVYAQKWRLFFECRAKSQEFLKVVEARMVHVAGDRPAFFRRTVGIVAYHQNTQEALNSIPGREFFRDPAAEFVGELLHELRTILEKDAAPK